MKDLNRKTFLLAAVAGLALSAGLASAQAERAPAPAEQKIVEDRPFKRSAEFDPAIVRERLVRRLVELEHETARIRNAVDKLDKGESPGDIFEDLRPPMERRVEGTRFPGEPGHPGEPHGKGGEMRHRVEAGPKGYMMMRDRLMSGEPLTPAERETLVQFLEANTPRVAAHLEQLQESRPEAAELILREVQQRMETMREVAANDPAALESHLKSLRTDMELRQAAMDFVRARRAADEAAQAEARAAIETLVPQRVEASLADRERELAAMKERLARMEAELAAARSDPQEMIAKRLDELLLRLENAPAEEPVDVAPRMRIRQD